MSLPRLNRQSAGYMAAQFFDAMDLLAIGTYDETNRPILYAARYEWVLDDAGIPVLQTVADTDGPVGGLICLPPKAPRVVAQWAFSCVPVKITSTGPLKATPVETGDGSGWTPATDLDEFEVYTSDGSAPAVNTFGIVVLGTELDDQKPLFFEGGSGGSTLKCFLVTANNADGTYEGVEYDEPNGTEIGDPAHPVPLSEDNSSVDVPVDQWVRAVPGTSVRDIGNGDGDQTVMWFSMPFGCPS